MKRAIALALVFALPCSALADEQPPGVMLDLPAQLVLHDGRSLSLPEQSLVLLPAEVARVDVHILKLERDTVRLEAENASLREQAGESGFSLKAVLLAAGAALALGAGGGWLLAR